MNKMNFLGVKKKEITMTSESLEGDVEAAHSTSNQATSSFESSKSTKTKQKQRENETQRAIKKTKDEKKSSKGGFWKLKKTQKKESTESVAGDKNKNCSQQDQGDKMQNLQKSPNKLERSATGITRSMSSFDINRNHFQKQDSVEKPNYSYGSPSRSPLEEKEKRINISSNLHRSNSTSKARSFWGINLRRSNSIAGGISSFSTDQSKRIVKRQSKINETSDSTSEKLDDVYQKMIGNQILGTKLQYSKSQVSYCRIHIF